MLIVTGGDGSQNVGSSKINIGIYALYPSFQNIANKDACLRKALARVLFIRAL